jgi:CDP-diacylglycerol---glycerol-3-phosphate 3-phosphatidyltransferase
MNLPNKITLLRFPLTAVFFFFFYDSPITTFFPDSKFNRHTYALIFFLIACISDWSDGYLARKRNQVTNFGKLWDPIADKILVTAAWVTLIANNAMPPWIALLLLSRDFAVNGLRMMAAQQGITLAAEKGGKIKTIIQLFTIGFLCTHYALIEDWGWNLPRPGLAWPEVYILYPACLVTSLASGWSYFRKSWSVLKI